MIKKFKHFLLCFLFLQVSYVGGQSSSELQRKKALLTREIKMLSKSLEKTSMNKRLSLHQINALNAQIHLRQQKINTINQEIRLLNHQINANYNTVHALQAQLEKLKKDYAAMILFAFKNQNIYNKLLFIFAADDFNQAYKRLRYLQQIAKYRQKQATYIQGTQENLHKKIVELGKNKKHKSNLLSDEEEEKKSLGEEKTQQTRVLDNLNRQETKLSKELKQKQKAAAQLNKAIQAAIRREIEIAKRKAEEEARAAAARAKAANAPPPAVKPIGKGSSVLSATPEAAKLSSDFLENRGRLPWPVVQGVIVEGFGFHSYGVNVRTANDGVNIKTSEGASVRAVFSGQVGKVLGIAGSYVVLIRHGEYFSIYHKLRSVSVSTGQRVNIKQTIGTVLTDPSDNTTEVHFEIRKGVTPLDPAVWLAK